MICRTWSSGGSRKVGWSRQLGAVCLKKSELPSYALLDHVTVVFLNITFFANTLCMFDCQIRNLWHWGSWELF